MIHHDVSLADLDCDELPTSVEIAWYKSGRDGYAYLLRQLEAPEHLSAPQTININAAESHAVCR
jgi:hypothetical protein